MTILKFIKKNENKFFYINFFVYICNKKIKIMELAKYKPTGLSFKVKRVRISGKVELKDGTTIPHEELKLNWIIIK